MLSKEALPAAIIGVSVLLSLRSPRFAADRLGQIVLTAVLLFGAFLLELVIKKEPSVFRPEVIGPVSRAGAMGFLAAAAARGFLKAPLGKDPVTAGLVFVGVLSMGSLPEGRLYPAVSVAILVLLTLALGHRDGVQHPKEDGVKGRAGHAALLFSGAAVVFSALVLLLPKLYRSTFGLIERAYMDAETGFSYSLSLGELTGMAQSDEVVMRIRGRRPDYLRGAVYARYTNGRWLHPAVDRETPMQSDGVSKAQTEIRFVDGNRERFFVPLRAKVHALVPPFANRTSTGILRPATDMETALVRFSVDKNAPTEALGSKTEYLDVPPNLESTLRKTADAWSAGAKDARAAMAKISDHLKRDYAYSLVVETSTASDPLLSFLTAGRQGNCEYFASALALLGRALRIPTRVVGGYRVHEYNPLGGYYIVRERNAHAWVEAFLPGAGWSTFDPTPSLREVSANEKTPFFSALLDATADRLRAVGRFIAALSAVQITLLLAGLVGGWLSVRLAGAFRRKRMARVEIKRGYRTPPDVVTALLERLSEVGCPRGVDEPLERFARRLAAHAPPQSLEARAAQGLFGYVEWRFGDRGDETRWRAQMESVLRGRRETSRSAL